MWENSLHLCMFRDQCRTGGICHLQACPLESPSPALSSSVLYHLCHHGLKLQGNFVLEQLAINKCHVGVSDIRWEQFLQDAKVIFEANCWELLPQIKLFNRKWTEQWLPVACWFCYLFNSQRGNRLLLFFDWPAWSFQKTDEVGTEEGEQQGMVPLTECVTLLYFKWSFRGVWGEPPATQRNRRDRPVWFALVIVDNWI